MCLAEKERKTAGMAKVKVDASKVRRLEKQEDEASMDEHKARKASRIGSRGGRQ